MQERVRIERNETPVTTDKSRSLNYINNGVSSEADASGVILTLFTSLCLFCLELKRDLIVQTKQCLVLFPETYKIWKLFVFIRSNVGVGGFVLKECDHALV